MPSDYTSHYPVILIKKRKKKKKKIFAGVYKHSKRYLEMMPTASAQFVGN
ncbi:CEI_1a_G0027220.mRNA.1.CDS.1 [Saccharomyces cerevisiae]|nr:CEI_1a_G0027220.mRNA.1.CDS.1 [Saccharomyces cerevisiae]CAI7246373.1 CEI_1a_G0027220.mRNA.1.CDS.1 [Saccharomyces cerevisiae]